MDSGTMGFSFRVTVTLRETCSLFRDPRHTLLFEREKKSKRTEEHFHSTTPSQSQRRPQRDTQLRHTTAAPAPASAAICWHQSFFVSKSILSSFVSVLFGRLSLDYGVLHLLLSTRVSSPSPQHILPSRKSPQNPIRRPCTEIRVTQSK